MSSTAARGRDSLFPALCDTTAVMVRPPAVAGLFYPSEPQELARQISVFCADGKTKSRALACVVPHAGYVYSGHVAGAVYGSIEIPQRSILLGPRHFPQGQPLAILTDGAFATPLGPAVIDTALATELLRACPLLREDAVAHAREHSLEVQLPFLQTLRPDLRLVPVVLGTDRYGAIEQLGHAVARVVKAQSEPVLVIASSDMNHYESDAITRVKDDLAIARVLALDPRGLFDTVREQAITMCGYAATVSMLIAALELGATQAALVCYATSGDVNGELDRVVGYAGIIVT
jgi:MEMO1 family protein